MYSALPAPVNSSYSMTFYAPLDHIDRRRCGIQKDRKSSSTGGGRAWSEGEEAYLLQTRQQKMPYKHIAAHLKKTELACRLHYHQLSHGCSRRKRTASESSSQMQSPRVSSASRLSSPGSEDGSPPHLYPHSLTDRHSVQLSPIRHLLAESTDPCGPSYSIPMSMALLPKPADLQQYPPISGTLRLDCQFDAPRYNFTQRTSLDRDRLAGIYNVRRAHFWEQIAAEYAMGTEYIAPELLEMACLETVALEKSKSLMAQRPPSPCLTPIEQGREELPPSTSQDRANSIISVKALLGMDASPRSPKEREMIRLMEESRRLSVLG